MPVYHYACRACEREFETSQSMRDESLTECPLPEGIDAEACGAVMAEEADYVPCGGPIHRVPQPIGIRFIGSGFYCNDYASRRSR
jgi:putative FmdB family regulatory protein